MLITAQTSFFLALLSLALGGLGSLAFCREDKRANLWGNGMAVLGSFFGLLSSVHVLATGRGFALSAESSFPYLSFSFNVDQLSAFFIFVISLIALLASIYGYGYVRHFYKKYNIGILGFYYNFFIAGMLGVVSAHNALFFLIAWEIMSLASYLLVIYENKDKNNIKAGTLYFVMTHIGTAFITLAFLLLYSITGSFDFGEIKTGLANVAPLTRDAIFVLFLIGFGTKAGIIPLHIWLPSAHPAAPTHVSALMSGVMIKTGIYMFIRMYFDIMPNSPAWWGGMILVIGAVSSLLGVLYALTEYDIKKLLAYSSIENVGIILLGLGSSLIFLSMDMKPLAFLGLAAALFHTLNHAIFKALLFMGAGSVISETHTRNMEDYGGLIKYMPQTAAFFLAGSLAISALPPFNGFFSEWAIFQSLFAGIRSLDISVGWIFIFAAGSLAFTGGLAAACFVKAFGAIFLARARSREVSHAKETSVPARIGMASLAVLTLVIGVLAGNISAVLGGIVGSLDIFRATSSALISSSEAVHMGDGFASISMPLIFMSLVFAVAVIFLAVSALSKNRGVVIGKTWDCGTALGPRMEITATGFSRSIITMFRGILKPSKQTEIEYQDADIRYFQKSKIVLLKIEDVYGRYLYRPFEELVTAIADKIRKIQSGNVNAYVLYIFIILIGLLLLSAI